MPPKRKYYNNDDTGSNKRSRGTKKMFKSNYKTKTNSRVTTIIRSPGPIPPRAICRMRYSTVVNSNGTTIDHLFNLNSTFDPDRTGTGHQPYGRDTYFALYNRYRVFAVQYRVTFTTTTGTAYACVVWDNNATTFTNYTLMMEYPKSLHTTMQTTQPVTLRGKLYLPSITGVTNAQYKDDDRFQATGGTDPAENIILHVGMFGTDGSAPGAGVTSALVDLIYYVEWFDQFTLGQS